MKIGTLLKLAAVTGIIAISALIMAIIEDHHKTNSPMGDLRRWMILVIIFLCAAAVTLILAVVIIIKLRKKCTS